MLDVHKDRLFLTLFTAKWMHFFGMVDLMKQRRRPEVRQRGPAQRKIGRPCGSFKDVDTAKLIADIARGVPIKVATAAVGISDFTFQNWLDSRPEFAQALAAEKQRVILEALDGIRSCSTKEREFRNLAWFLERVYPETFAPQDKGGFHFTQNNVMLGDLDEARRILDAAKALPYRSETNERIPA